MRRALTVDDGWSAVTDNYFKVRLDEQHPRNQWVDASAIDGPPAIADRRGGPSGRPR